MADLAFVLVVPVAVLAVPVAVLAVPVAVLAVPVAVLAVHYNQVVGLSDHQVPYIQGVTSCKGVALGDQLVILKLSVHVIRRLLLLAVVYLELVVLVRLENLRGPFPLHFVDY